MFGNDVITRCPYCNQIIAKNIGITQYYKYKNKLVCIDSHCGKQFITEYQSDKSRDFLHRYVIPKSLFGLVTDTKDITMSFLGQNLNEDELTEKVIEQLKDKIKDLPALGLKYGADIVVSGHTHKPSCERIDNMLLINPGSSNRPIESNASIALLKINDEVDVEFIDL